MPYIKEARREDISGIKQDLPANAGELNYLLTNMIVDYLISEGLTYQTCNDIVGALDNCKDEFKRRIQDPYEDIKILENGDVYPRVDVLLTLRKSK